MSLFDPRSLYAVIGVILFLVALYLILANGTGANTLLSTIAGGTVGLVGTLQGRAVSSNGTGVG